MRPCLKDTQTQTIQTKQIAEPESGSDKCSEEQPVVAPTQQCVW